MENFEDIQITEKNDEHHHSTSTTINSCQFDLTLIPPLYYLKQISHIV